jgi:hypothetical protein
MDRIRLDFSCICVVECIAGFAQLRIFIMLATASGLPIQYNDNMAEAAMKILLGLYTSTMVCAMKVNSPRLVRVISDELIWHV